MKSNLLLLLLLTMNFVISQTRSNLDLSKSKEYVDTVKTDSIISFYTSNEGLTGIVRDAKKNMVFDIFDEKMTRIYTKVIDKEKKETFVGTLSFANEVKIFTDYAHKKNNRILFCHVLNMADKSYKKVKVFEIDIDARNTLYSEMKSHQTLFALSPNGKQIAITTDNIHKNDDSYSVKVYNSSSLEEIYHNKYLQHTDKVFELQDFKIDDNGVVYTLGKQYLKGIRSEIGGRPNYNFVLTKITDLETQELNIDLEDYHIKNLSISLFANQLQLLGLFSEKNVSNIKGGCSFSIDPSLLVLRNSHTKYLPKKVYEDMYGNFNSKNEKKKELSNFNIDYVINDHNGNTFILAEEFYITSGPNMSMGNGLYSGGNAMPHYDDVLILKFNKSGQMTWGRSIFKRAKEHSYSAFLKGNRLHIILNSGKNLVKKEDGRTKVSKSLFESLALYNFSFSDTGDVSHLKLLDYNNRDRYLPQYGYYYNGTFVMTSSGKKKHFALLK